MITTYLRDDGRLRRGNSNPLNLDGVVWIDLCDPSKDEESAVEQALGIGVPTREEMEEIEISSRLYYENDAAFMIATLPSHTDSDEPELAPVTFVLAGDRLITVRNHEPRAFRTLPLRAGRVDIGCHDGECVLVALLEAQVDRLADVLERVSREVHLVSRQVFRRPGPKPKRSADFQAILETIGSKGDLTSNILDCLASLERMVGFLTHAHRQSSNGIELRERIRTLARDCRSLIEHAGSLTNKVAFLLDATLGLVGIEQNAIIKIFSVAAVVFLPPTLIASIYGMNFDVMPELHWLLGYPFALLLMVISAVMPYWYFKRRNWL
jgi:magnesium transporter